MKDHNAPETGTDLGLDEEAALWVVRMQGPDAERHRASFEHWLALGALHRPSFDRIARTYETVGALGRPPRRVAPRAAMAAMMLAALILTPFLVDRPGDLGAQPQMRRSGIRQVDGVEMATLADGSTALIGRQTRLSFDETRSQRLLRIETGHVRIHVAAARRPFIVVAGSLQITARGTVFDVVVDQNDSALVHLIEGKVDVARLDKPGPPVRLKPAQSMGSNFVHLAIPPQAVPLAPAWADAIGTFNGTSVQDVLASANHLAGRPVIKADPDVARRRLIGTIAIGEPARLAADLAALFALEIVVAPDHSMLLRSRLAKKNQSEN